MLTADIDLSGETWTPIGNYSADNSNQYTGAFDGAGHTIDHLTLNSTADYQGLVGYLGNGGAIKDLTLGETCSVTGGEYVGGICGSNNNTITNCYNTGAVTTAGKYLGGICGMSNGSITNCYWLDTACNKGVGSGSGGVTAKTAEEFASGEVAYLLNGSSSDSPVWYQNLDNGRPRDDYPVLDSSHGIVYCIEEDPVRYSNDPDGEPGQIISVDITWGDLSFTYSDGTWNPSIHTYDGAGWNVDEEGGNSIKVENTGNTDVNVTYDYITVENGITGSFTDGENPVSAPVSLPVNGSSAVYLILAGKPEKELEKATIGSVTVTIGGESE